jgi:E3 ubiquitin-protein ligase RNF14
VSRDISDGILTFEVPVELEHPMEAFIMGGETSEGHLSLSSLPPVLLEIVLPPMYPLSEAPEIASFHVSGSWIPHSGHLRQALMDMWQPGESVLFSRIEWILSAGFLKSMNLIQDDDVLRCVMTSHEGSSFIPPITT